VLVVVVAALAGRELAGLAEARGIHLPAAFVPAAAAVASLSVASISWSTTSDADAALIVAMGLVLAAGAISLVAGPPEPSTIARAAVLVMAPMYVGLPLGVFAWVQSTAGPAMVTWLVAVIAVSDSAQYFAGRAFGRRKLAPLVSPAKTVEGAVGGLVVVAIFGAATAQTIGIVSPPGGALLAVGLAGAGIIGDLFESQLKRSAGVKDSSTLIPGHGGVLDRIDSHLFAAPAFYLCARYLL
jgi:phosphatidate cytidylyltransferase